MLNYFLWQVYNYLEFFVCLHAHGLNSPSCDLSHVLGKNKTKQKKPRKLHLNPEGRACRAGVTVARLSWPSRVQTLQQPSICCRKASHRLAESPPDPYEIVRY